MLEDQIQKNMQALKKEGIRKPKANNLARLSWVTEEYIRAHVRQAIEVEGQTLGLAIWRMERKETP